MAVRRMTAFQPSAGRKGDFEVWKEGDLSVRATGPVYACFSKSDFLPSSFHMKAGEKSIHIDPFGLGDEEKTDFILITHAHPDHFSMEDIDKVYDEGTIIVCPRNVSKKLSGYHVIPVHPGETVSFGDLKIEATPAYSKGLPTHPKTWENVGYLVTRGNFSLYHAGDTDYVKELQSISEVTLALVPIGGGNLTMSVKDAVEFVNAMKPKAVMPMHYDLSMELQKEFADRIHPEIEVILYGMAK